MPYDDPVTLTDCIIMNFPFNRNSWHHDNPETVTPPKKISGLHRQDSFEKSHSPSPIPPGSSSSPKLQVLRHNHSLKYSGGALHGNPNPQHFDHHYSQESFVQNEQQGFLFCSHISRRFLGLYWCRSRPKHS